MWEFNKFVCGWTCPGFQVHLIILPHHIRLCQQPPKVIRRTITHSYVLPLSWLGFSAKLGRNRATPEVIGYIDRAASAIIFSNDNNVGTNAKVLAGIVCDLAIGLDAEIQSAGPERLPEFEKHIW